MPPFVDISDVSLLYDGGAGGGTLALEGATLRIDKGEFVAIVGPSAAESPRSSSSFPVSIWQPAAA